MRSDDHECFEVVRVPTCGGHGLQATDPIRKGSVVLREKPIAILEAAAFEKAAQSDPKLRQLLSNAAASPPGGSMYDESAWWPRPKVAAPEAIGRFAELEFAKQSPHAQQRWMSLVDSFSTSAACKTPGNVVRSNAFTDAQSGSSYLYETLCRTNHSCDPNMHRHFEGGGVVVAVTARDVADREPLTISYLSDAHLKLPTAERRRILLDKFNFLCACERCRPAALPAPCDDEKLQHQHHQQQAHSRVQAVTVLAAAQATINRHLQACNELSRSGMVASETPSASLLEAVGACADALRATEFARRAFSGEDEHEASTNDDE